MIAGENYGQGSSREHAALATRFLGLRIVIAKTCSRIHWQNLVNFGVLPLEFVASEDLSDAHLFDLMRIARLREQIQNGDEIELTSLSRSTTIRTIHRLSERQIDVILHGGIINQIRWTKH